MDKKYTQYWRNSTGQTASVEGNGQKAFQGEGLLQLSVERDEGRWCARVGLIFSKLFFYQVVWHVIPVDKVELHESPSNFCVFLYCIIEDFYFPCFVRAAFVVEFINNLTLKLSAEAQLLALKLWISSCGFKFSTFKKKWGHKFKLEFLCVGSNFKLRPRYPLNCM